MLLCNAVAIPDMKQSRKTVKAIKNSIIYINSDNFTYILGSYFHLYVGSSSFLSICLPSFSVDTTTVSRSRT